MKVLIEGDAEKIADLVVALQERQVDLSIGQEVIDSIKPGKIGFSIPKRPRKIKLPPGVGRERKEKP